MLHVGITGVRVAGLGVSYEMETRNRSIRKMPKAADL